MRWSDEITLISRGEPGETNENGFPVPEGETRVTIFASRRSIGLNEFYKADMKGYNPRFTFLVHSEEYSDQEEAEYDGKPYYILRSYTPEDGDYTELVLSELPRGGRNDG